VDPSSTTWKIPRHSSGCEKITSHHFHIDGFAASSHPHLRCNTDFAGGRLPTPLQEMVGSLAVQGPRSDRRRSRRLGIRSPLNIWNAGRYRSGERHGLGCRPFGCCHRTMGSTRRSKPEDHVPLHPATLAARRERSGFREVGSDHQTGPEQKGFIAAVKQPASVTNLTRFARPNEAPTTATAEAYIRKRGRPPKHRKSESSNENGYSIARAQSKSRSPGRPRYGASPGKPLPPRARSQSRARSQVRSAQPRGKQVGYLGLAVAEWKAAVVTWCLAALGGLGVAVIGVFGAEVTESV
jgi:hypothetical protein